MDSGVNDGRSTGHPQVAAPSGSDPGVHSRNGITGMGTACPERRPAIVLEDPSERVMSVATATLEPSEDLETTATTG